MTDTIGCYHPLDGHTEHGPWCEQDDEPGTGEEWIIAHIRKLEVAVDEILFALKAGGYAPKATP